MQSNWAALQTKIKAKGGRALRPEKRDKPAQASGSSPEDARETKKRKKRARRRANDDGTRGRSSEQTSETATTSRRSRIANASNEPVRVDAGDAAPRTRPPDETRILDDAAPLAPERRRALISASALGGPNVSIERSLETLSRAAIIEAARLEAVSHLCFAFERAASPLLGANRWANAFEELMFSHDAAADPLLPTDDAARAFCEARFEDAARAEPPMRSFVEPPTGSATATPRDAVERSATASIVAATRRARDAVARAAARAAGAGAGASEIRAERLDPPTAKARDAGQAHPARVRLSLGRAKVELRLEHFRKLACLWNSRARAAGVDDETVDENGANVETDGNGDARERFLRAAFACAARVVAAQGGMHRVSGGHHAALHGEVFDVLKYGSLRVEAELFASPLNCRYDAFCSAHADVDAPFGSLGSFFAFSPRDGSFEVNPPFESALVARVAARLEMLLVDAEARGAALSFAVITPYWPRRAAWDALRKSAFRRRAPLVVAARDHGYVDGAQHCKKKTHKPASCDTCVLFLQTSLGRVKYAPSDDTEEALRAAFRPRRGERSSRET